MDTLNQIYTKPTVRNIETNCHKKYFNLCLKTYPSNDKHFVK